MVEYKKSVNRSKEKETETACYRLYWQLFLKFNIYHIDLILLIIHLEMI